MTADPAAPLPDGWYGIYSWLRRLTSSPVTAEELTVDVCRRLRSGSPAWLADKSDDVQQRFFVVQVVLERRGVFSDGDSSSAKRKGSRRTRRAPSEPDQPGEPPSR